MNKLLQYNTIPVGVLGGGGIAIGDVFKIERSGGGGGGSGLHDII